MQAKIALSLLATLSGVLACDNCYGPQNDVTLTRHVRRMQPSALNATVNPLRALEWGQLNFLHTTDTHGWLEGHIKERNYGADWGDYVSFTTHMKQMASNYGVDLLLVDTGDLHDGAGLSDATNPNGLVSNPIFENIDYDLLTIGNHELYITEVAYETFNQFSKVYGDRYLTSNVQILNPNTGQYEYIGAQYRYFTTPMGLRIMSFGILYDFTGNSNVSRVIKAATLVQQAWFKNAVNFDQPIDLFVLLGHNPPRATVGGSTFGTIYNAIRSMRREIPIQVFGGHSHVRDFVVYDDKATGLESGRYCETLGWLAMSGIATNNEESYEGWGAWKESGNRIPSNVPQPTRPAVATGTASSSSRAVATPTGSSSLRYARRYMDWNKRTFEYHATGSQIGNWQRWNNGWFRAAANQANKFDTQSGVAVSSEITADRNVLNLTALYGCAPQTWCASCVPFESSGSIYSLLEQALATVVINQTRATIPRIIILNTGSIRFDLVQGPFTYDDSFIVSPFTDGFQFIPNVPYQDASQVLEIMNAAPGDKKRDLSAKDFDFGPMHSIGRENCADPPITHNHLTSRSYSGGRVLRRQTTLTPGYTTTDDFGTDGDDTAHTSIPYYPLPENFQKNASFPADGSKPTTVDLIFLDYIASGVIAALKSLGTSYTAADASYYLARTFTTNSYLPAYAKLKWQANVPNCPVGGTAV